MHIVITGGAGFLGQKLARRLLETVPDATLTLFDIVAPPAQSANPRVRVVVGDANDPAAASEAMANGADAVFHLAAVVSGEAEADFDKGMRVNIDATRALLDACRRLSTPPKFLFASSLAVFGGPLPDPVPESWNVTPQNSYGAQKAVAELLINDMSRKGFIDGRVLRLPTITVRPGKPNRAASSFASGIIREPLNGANAVCPVPPETRLWLQSPRRVIENFLIALAAPAAAFDHTRTINTPGITVSVGDMIAALRRVAGDAVADRVRWEVDPVINRIVGAWPAALVCERGRALGMRADGDFADVIRAYIADDL